MNIIEKLGIEGIPCYYEDRDYSVCDELPVRKVENQRNVMIEALIDIAIDKSFFTLNGESQRRVDIARKTLEKITGKLWKEIKKLIEE